MVKSKRKSKIRDPVTVSAPVEIHHEKNLTVEDAADIVKDVMRTIPTDKWESFGLRIERLGQYYYAEGLRYRMRKEHGR